MKATDLLKKQHRLVEKLFSSFEAAKTPPQRAKIFEEIAANLVAHDAIEREIFYPACEKAMGKDDDTLTEALVEHGLVEFSIFTAEKGKKKEAFASHVTVLAEVVKHHVKEEEEELLPKAEKALGAEKLEALGVQMQAAFDKALAKDFKKPLRTNLDQVLVGKTKTAKQLTARAAR